MEEATGAPSHSRFAIRAAAGVRSRRGLDMTTQPLSALRMLLSRRTRLLTAAFGTLEASTDVGFARAFHEHSRTRRVPLHPGPTPAHGQRPGAPVAAPHVRGSRRAGVIRGDPPRGRRPRTTGRSLRKA